MTPQKWGEHITTVLTNLKYVLSNLESGAQLLPVWALKGWSQSIEHSSHYQVQFHRLNISCLKRTFKGFPKRFEGLNIYA